MAHLTGIPLNDRRNSHVNWRIYVCFKSRFEHGLSLYSFGRRNTKHSHHHYATWSIQMLNFTNGSHASFRYWGGRRPGAVSFSPTWERTDHTPTLMTSFISKAIRSKNIFGFSARFLSFSNRLGCRSAWRRDGSARCH